MSLPYLTATATLVKVNQNLQLGSSNVMLDQYGNQMWVPGSTVQWQPTPSPPVVSVPGAGFTATTSYAGGTYRWVGNEIVYNVNTQTQVVAIDTSTADRTGNYTLSVPYPISTAAYGNSNVVVGDLWMYVMTAGTVLTFKAYARTQASVANTVALRYLSGSTDDTLATIDAGSTFVLQGSLTYVTTSVNGGAGLIPPLVVPAGFSQNQLGQVLLNGSGSNFQPRAQLDVAGSNNVPALIVDQRSAGVGNDVVDFMVAGVKKVVIDSAGNVGVGTTVPGSALHVVGNARIQGDLTVNGTQTIINTNVGTTEQLVITNDGTGPALVVNQTGAQPVVDFQDDGVSALQIVNGGNVGIGTTLPQAKLHVNGIISTDTGIAMVMNNTTTSGGHNVYINPIACEFYNASAPGVPNGITSVITGQMYNLGSSQASDYCTIYAPTMNQYNFFRTYVNLVGGTYRFQADVGKFSDRGIVTLVINGTSFGSFDTYNATNLGAISTINSISIPVTGSYKVELQTNSKNPSSTGYFFLWRQAAFIRTS